MLCNHANMTAARLGGVAVRSLPVGARGPRAVAFLSLPFPFDCSDAKVHYILSLYCLAYIQIQRAKLHATPGEHKKDRKHANNAHIYGGASDALGRRFLLVLHPLVLEAGA